LAAQALAASTAPVLLGWAGREAEEKPPTSLEVIPKWASGIAEGRQCSPAELEEARR